MMVMHPAFVIARALYQHLSHRADRIFERGWRRALGWCVPITWMFSYVTAPWIGIADRINYDAVNVVIGLGIAAFFARGAEQVMNNRAPGGLVNNLAIS